MVEIYINRDKGWDQSMTEFRLDVLSWDLRCYPRENKCEILVHLRKRVLSKPVSCISL